MPLAALSARVSFQSSKIVDSDSLFCFIFSQFNYCFCGGTDPQAFYSPFSMGSPPAVFLTIISLCSFIRGCSGDYKIRTEFSLSAYNWYFPTSV